jgi:hypothetical protein
MGCGIIMPFASKIDDPSHWLKCAVEVREMAARIFNAGSRTVLLQAASGYEQMARSAEERALAKHRRHI